MKDAVSARQQVALADHEDEVALAKDRVDAVVLQRNALLSPWRPGPRRARRACQECAGCAECSCRRRSSPARFSIRPLTRMSVTKFLTNALLAVVAETSVTWRRVRRSSCGRSGSVRPSPADCPSARRSCRLSKRKDVEPDLRSEEVVFGVRRNQRAILDHPPRRHSGPSRYRLSTAPKPARPSATPRSCCVDSSGLITATGADAPVSMDRANR